MIESSRPRHEGGDRVDGCASTGQPGWSSPSRHVGSPDLQCDAATDDVPFPAGKDLTNARTEGFNRVIKQVKRVGCGFRNQDNYRRRIMLHVAVSRAA